MSWLHFEKLRIVLDSTFVIMLSNISVFSLNLSHLYVLNMPRVSVLFFKFHICIKIYLIDRADALDSA